MDLIRPQTLVRLLLVVLSTVLCAGCSGVRYYYYGPFDFPNSRLALEEARADIRTRVNAVKPIGSPPAARAVVLIPSREVIERVGVRRGVQSDSDAVRYLAEVAEASLLGRVESIRKGVLFQSVRVVRSADPEQVVAEPSEYQLTLVAHGPDDWRWDLLFTGRNHRYPISAGSAGDGADREQRFLSDLARTGDRIREQWELFARAFNAESARVRAEATGRIDIQTMLASIAARDTAPMVREAAVSRLSDPAVLRRMAAEDPDSGVRAAAERRLADTRFAGPRSVDAADPPRQGGADSPRTKETREDAIAVGDSGVVLRLTAVSSRRADPDLLLRIAMDSSDPKASRSAVRRITDPGVLAAVATQARSADIRAVASARLIDPAALAGIALSDPDASVRGAAILRLRDDRTLARVIASETAPENRKLAVGRVIAQDLLAGFATGQGDPGVRQAATARLTEQALLARIAVSDPDSSVRRSAVERLDDQALLLSIIRDDRSEEVRDAAMARLTPESFVQHGDELAARPVPFVTAIRAGLITAQVTGSGIQSVSVKVSNATSRRLRVAIAPGVFFANSGRSQDMIATEMKSVDLRPGATVGIDVAAACAAMHREIPRGDAKFSIEPAARSAELRRLAPFLRGERFAVKQAAVWIVTDDASRTNLATLVSQPSAFAGTGFGGTPVIGDDDVLRAARLLREAGIDYSRKKIYPWLAERE